MWGGKGDSQEMIEVSEGNSVTSGVPCATFSSGNHCWAPAVISLGVYSVGRVLITRPVLVLLERGHFKAEIHTWG